MNAKTVLILIIAVLGLSLMTQYFHHPSIDLNPIHSRQESVLDVVKREKKLRVGYSIYPPYSQKDPKTGELSGYSLDIVKEIATQMHVEPIFVETTWETYISDLQAGKFDLISPIFPTIQRAMEVNFTEPFAYLSDVVVLTSAAENRFNVITDLNRSDVTIAIPQGWTVQTYAEKHLEKAKRKIFKGDSVAMAITDVLTGGSTVALVDAQTTREYLKTNKDQKLKALFLNQPIKISAAAFIVRKGDQEWLTFLNASLELLKTEGALKQLANKYDLSMYTLERTFIQE